MHSLISPSTVQSAARDHAGPHLPTALLTTLFRTLAAALPLDGATAEIAAETFQAACALFAASQPGDAMAAAAATRAVAAHFAAMDMYARASRPGLSDDTARRLRASANTCSRTAEAVRTTRPAARQPAAPPPQVPQRPSVPIVPDSTYQPRDRFGQPIKLHEFQRMTGKQRRAVYASPPNPELEAEAIAEEAALIAEQQALAACQGVAGAADGLTARAMRHERDDVATADRSAVSGRASESLATVL